MFNQSIQPGRICTLDPYNILKQDDIGVVYVRVVKRIKFKLFKKSIWEVVDLENEGDVYKIPEYLLYPEGMSVIRYPMDLPTFNDIDLDLCTRLIDSFEGDSETITLRKSDLNRLKALTEKIRLCISLKEV